MAGLKVKSIFLATDQDGERKVEVTLTNGTVIIIMPCFDSWMQSGGAPEELQLTVPVAEEHNEWLHGGELHS